MKNYFTRDLKILEHQKINSTITFGIEYGENFVRCCAGSKIWFFELINAAVHRIEFSPHSNVWTYGLFSDKLKTRMEDTLRFVRYSNQNCTIYVRVVLKESDAVQGSIRNQYKARLAHFSKAWFTENKREEILILEAFPTDVQIPSTVEMLQSFINSKYTENFLLDLDHHRPNRTSSIVS